jgi:GTPase SAR1 family protein
MRRVKLSFADLKVDFCDRGRALQQVEEFAERGTWHPIVVFGPEGCGKTAYITAYVYNHKEKATTSSNMLREITARSYTQPTNIPTQHLRPIKKKIQKYR